MRLTALVESRDHVCARYRFAAFQAGLREAGHPLELQDLPRGWWQRWRAGRLVRDADLVVLQRRLLSYWELALLRRQSRRLLFDLDDAVWMRDSFARRGHDSHRRLSRFRRIARMADGVVAGNSFLAENSREAGARRTWVIPTCVDVAKYPLALHDQLSANLVWIGSRSTLRGLEAISPQLEAIGRGIPGTRLKLICDHFLRLTNLPVIETPWSEPTEAAEIAAADIGISWIPDDPWSQGKCGLKLLQYMAAGLPVVTNPAGVHPEMVRHGENGFLVNSPDEWVEAIRTLADDPDLRRRMGQAGRRRVEQEYSVEAGVRMWCDVLAHFSFETGQR